MKQNRVILREWGVVAWSEESWNIFQVHVHRCSVGLTWIAHTFINTRDVYAPFGNMTCWNTSSSNTGLKTRANYLPGLSCNRHQNGLRQERGTVCFCGPQLQERYQVVCRHQEVAVEDSCSKTRFFFKFSAYQSRWEHPEAPNEQTTGES